MLAMPPTRAAKRSIKLLLTLRKVEVLLSTLTYLPPARFGRFICVKFHSISISVIKCFPSFPCCAACFFLFHHACTHGIMSSQFQRCGQTGAGRWARDVSYLHHDETIALSNTPFAPFPYRVSSFTVTLCLTFRR